MANNMNSMVMRNMRRERVYKAVMIDLHSLGVLEDDEIEKLIGYVPGGKKADTSTVITSGKKTAATTTEDDDTAAATATEDDDTAATAADAEGDEE